MRNKDMMTITVLPNGNTVYSLKSFTGKMENEVKAFFNRTYGEYHKILKDACGSYIESMAHTEEIYKSLYHHAYKLFANYRFLDNHHNFVAFLQQFKHELEVIGISSFLPTREISAVQTLTIEIDPDGVQVKNKPMRKRTHYKDTTKRILRHDCNYHSDYFAKCLVDDKSQLKDDTIVVRTKYGNRDVMFFNIVKCDSNAHETLTTTNDIKSYEIDRLKGIYANKVGINYMDVRPISYKRWCKMSDEKKIGTHVKCISADIMKSIERFR